VFELNEIYANRKGNYKVLEINGPKMTVEYEDGTTATLNMAIQYRIWENIVVERAAAEAKRLSSTRRSANKQNTRFYIKTMLVSDEPDLAIPGLRQRIAAAPVGTLLSVGDRLIYYAIEPQRFFAVTTITGSSKSGKAKDYLFGDDESEIDLYPIDIDSHIITVKMAVPIDGVELESLPDYRVDLATPSTFHAINEDDFEMLSELVMEVDDDFDEDEDDDDDMDEDDVDADDILSA
jgi:hypothetical protein